ncbi:MAG: FAD-dependent oxidoreductase, partial [Steroidobacteraceae bacterium]|nr:FAD-dependent oxidoreductase [Deltaproteobacteria bacterium]
MTFIYRNLTLSINDSEESLPGILAAKLAVDASTLNDIRILRKAVDARKKQNIRLVYTISFSTDNELRKMIEDDPALEWQPDVMSEPMAAVCSPKRIVIVGSGPAGLFAALRLAQYGLTATIIERGEPVERRALTVQRFWKDGLLDPESNVQFGEGGAGTFSDGKLTCRSKDHLVPWVLQQLV